MAFLQKHIDEIAKVCSRHKVNRLFAFGSVLSDQFQQESDVDLIVDFYPMDAAVYATNYYSLKSSLENLFQRQVDLLEEKALKNPYFLQSVGQQKILIYE